MVMNSHLYADLLPYSQTYRVSEVERYLGPACSQDYSLPKDQLDVAMMKQILGGE